MLIIQIDVGENGAHNLQSRNDAVLVWEEGYIEVPAHLEAAAWESMGWCDLTIEDGVLTGITLTERPEPEPEPEPEPTVEDRIASLEAKNAALTQSNQFLEDCLVEMAGIVYA